jgi:aspartyl-tRNA(Asn)/glutamyl-tRNA(Gln) amidotransferase subunit B
MWFSRKIYFYPDLCRHYQITQYETPVGLGGFYDLGKKRIRITRAHLEEDPGSMKKSGDGALIDYNRSGMPLVEIVTEPDISTPSEAREFLTALLRDIHHVADLQDGERSVRVDCNISVGTERCEVKNVTGLKNVERALMFEAVRQTKIIRSGGKIVRETRHYDEARKVTTSARKKEFESDYAYIGEPDIGMIDVSSIASAISIKESPLSVIARLVSKFGIDEKMAKQMVNTSMKMAELFEQIAENTDVQCAVRWVTGPVSAGWKQLEKDIGAKKDAVIDTVRQFRDGKVNDAECAMILKAIITGTEANDIRSEQSDLDALIRKAIADNPSVADDYAKNEKAANRIIGAVMNAAGGSYSSSDVVEAAKRILDGMI